MRSIPEVERKIFVERSEQVWSLMDEDHHTLMVVGIIARSQVSIPELWMLMCEPFKWKLKTNWADVKEKFEILLAEYPRVMVKVDAAVPVGKRFVELLGFTEYHRDVKGDREYIYYEVNRGVRNSSRT